MILASADFYRAFEDRFRGPRAEIKERLKVYLPFIQPLQEKCAPAMALDLGCGRGEWLELLTEHGFSAQGVDIDDGMLSACRRRGLNVHTADALAFLKALPDESQALVSGFHIAEHLPFDVLQELVCQALRVLIPGGLLILETPNPENITVGTASFYLDPTHQRPLPPPLLAFLTEFAGFRRQKILRLQESSELLRSGAPITLLQVLSGVSPDYAVVAQKNGPIELFSALDSAFSMDCGLTLDTLANQFQLQADAKAQQAEAKAQQAEAKAQQAEIKAQQAEAASKETLMQLDAVYASTSWRVTAPLRAVKDLWFRYTMLASRLKNRFGEKRPLRIKEKLSNYFIKAPLIWGVHRMQRHRRLKNGLRSMIRRFPWVERRLLTWRAALYRPSYAILSGGGSYSSEAVFDPHSALADIWSAKRRSSEEIIANIKSELSALKADTNGEGAHG